MLDVGCWLQRLSPTHVQDSTSTNLRNSRNDISTIMDDRDIKPDDCLLEHIFTTNQPKAISIILQGWDKCVFKAELPPNSQNHHITCIVRLESEDGKPKAFAMVACMQQIAATIIPDLVPKTFQVGKAANAQGRIFDFLVVEVVEGDLLENVWQLMSTDEQRNVVAELVEALRKLHSVRLSDKMAEETMRKMLGEDNEEAQRVLETPGFFGGPHTGLLNNGHALLQSIMEKRKVKKPFCTMESVGGDSQDVRIQSSFEDMGSIVINHSDIGRWAGESVLCHNDLTPRNLILQSRISVDGKSNYKLAGIIDWELAGFYPPSYELSLQDTYFSCDRHLSFYLLLKEHMQNIVPRSSSQIALVRGMELIYESQQRLLLNRKNISARIRKTIMEYSKLTRDNDPYAGWTRKPQDGPCLEYSSADIQKLVDDMVKETDARRKLKAERSSTAKS